MKNRFILSSEESELLLEFETAGTLQKLSEMLYRDQSQVSRMMQKIQSKIPVIEKINRRWQITELGKSYNEATRDYLLSQAAKSRELQYLKIGTNREFAGRVLSADFEKFSKLFNHSQLRLNSYESGVEKFILNGELDIGIDCERPMQPEISFKTVFSQDVIPVASPQFKKKYLKQIQESPLGFLTLPHLLCDRLFPHLLFKTSENEIQVKAAFNDIGLTRTTCANGLGWALLPEYSVQKELKSGELVRLSSAYYSTSYGVWWLRSRAGLRPHVDKLMGYLKEKFS